MAEAWANRLGAGNVKAFSAGSAPLGRIIPETYDVMREKGVELDGQWSKSLDEVPVKEMDVVVGMGCEVVCPVPPGFKGRVVEWNIPDPYGQSLDSFRRVRDLIESHVKGLLDELQALKQERATETR